jgi:hypothetical protein
MHNFRRGDELKGNRTEDNVRVRNAAQVRRLYFKFI